MKRYLSVTFAWGIGILLGCLVFKYSLYLAAMRIYQVDECQNVFVARILATGQIESYWTAITLFEAPLVWLARDATNSADLFASARLLSLLIFWLNLVLIVLATGEKLLSRRGLIAFVGAATLAPLWDYGFEVRADNLLLTELLLMWCAVRQGNARPASYLIAGALAVAMQFTAFKAIVYTIPFTVMILAFPPRGKSVPRWKLTLAWSAGALAMFLVVRFACGASGIWDNLVAGVSGGLGEISDGFRFAPWKTLGRLLSQTPLLVSLLVGALAALLAEFWRHGKEVLSWDGVLPEALFFGIAFAALLANPGPYPYNLLHLVPYGFLLAFRYACILWKDIKDRPSLLSVALAVVVFTHFVPFGVATRRHLDRPNFRQLNLIQLAEDLTDPTKDPVYDGIGLVVSRPSIHFRWFLYYLNVHQFNSGVLPHARDMLAARPAVVFIPNYRTDWLAEEDHLFIREHYVPLADDFWVLGKVLPPGGGSFEIIHPGRYQITTKDDSCIAGTGDTNRFTLSGIMRNAEKGKAAGSADSPVRTNLVATLDGAPLAGLAVELEVGTHRIETSPDTEPAVVWLGPTLKRLQPLPNSDHRRLFVNWY